MDKKAKQCHILVIRFSALGDVAMTVPVINAVKKNYPKLRFTVVSRSFHKPLFEGVDFFEAKLKGRHKGILGLWRLAKELHELQIDAVADLHNVLRSKILKLFLQVRGIKVVQINKGRKEKNAIIRTKNKQRVQLKSSHQRYADVFAELGYPVILNNADVFGSKQMDASISKITGKKEKNWIGIAPFAAHSGKMYPFHKMTEVVNLLEKTNKYKIFLFGAGNAEKQQLETLIGTNSNVVNMAGRLLFSEELQLISNIDVMLSMDSANAHLAANYGVPVITLWGVTHPCIGFYPFGQPRSNALLPDLEKFPLIPTSVYGNKVPQGYEKVMESIPPNKVFRKISEVLML